MIPARTLGIRRVLACASKCTSTVLLSWLAVPPAAAQSQTWIEQFGTGNWDRARTAAPASSGGVFVAGSTAGALAAPNSGADDIWIARYDSIGNSMWTRQIGTPANDWPLASASDGAGGVYVGGYTAGQFSGANSAPDAWLARYDGAGTQLWLRQLGTSLWDFAHHAAPAGSTGVYLVGDTKGSFGGANAGEFDVWLARYDELGNPLWIRQYGTTGEDAARAAAIDGSGGLYLAGHTTGALGGAHAGARDAWLARYDGAGNRLWIRQLGSSGEDYAFATAPDGMGGVYVGGTTSGVLGASTVGFEDAWLARYDGSGNQLWIRQFGTQSPDFGDVAAADESGGVHVGGRTFSNMGGSSAGGTDVWLARYDAAGSQTWILQLGTSKNESAGGAVPAGSGGVYLAGVTAGSLAAFNPGGEDAWLARFDPPCVAPPSYCTAKVNSAGCVPSMTTQGSTSASMGSGFTIITTDVLDKVLGTYLYSKSGPGNAPFQGGILCGLPPLLRTPLMNSGGMAPCGGSFQIDFNAYVASGKDPGLVAGQQVWIQAWSRDPGFAPPDNTSLSDAVTFTLCP